MDVLKRLPVELVESIVTQIDDSRDLQALAQTCQIFRNLAERELYRYILIRKGSQAQAIAAALRSYPERATWIRSFRNACDSKYFGGLMDHIPGVYQMTNLRHLLVETPDCNNTSSELRRPWLGQQKRYQEIFLHVVQTGKVLPRLRSCTLHFVDHRSSLYHIGDYSTIFLHPTLEELMISCAHVGPREKLHELVRRAKSRTTNLRKLEFVECDFNLEGLSHLLTLPRCLTSLTLTEAAHYQTYHRDRLYAGLQPSQCLHFIATLQPSLSYLSLSLLQYEPSNLFCMPYTDLSPFQCLTTIEYTHPCLPTRTPHTPKPPKSGHCTLAHAGTASFNLGGPSTTSLTYHSIPLECWDRCFAFFTCALAHKSRHNIPPGLKFLKLVLIDDKLLFQVPLIPPDAYARYQRMRRRRTRDVRELILQLGFVANRTDVDVHLIVEWVQPTGNTIPPYLVGEARPLIRREFDSKGWAEMAIFEAMGRERRDKWGLGEESVLDIAAGYGYGSGDEVEFVEGQDED